MATFQQDNKQETSPLETESESTTAPGPSNDSIAQRAEEARASRQALYEIREGDTWQSIAQAHYGDPNRWMEIYQANQAFYPSPLDPLVPGTQILIPSDQSPKSSQDTGAGDLPVYGPVEQQPTSSSYLGLSDSSLFGAPRQDTGFSQFGLGSSSYFGSGEQGSGFRSQFGLGDPSWLNQSGQQSDSFSRYGLTGPSIFSRHTGLSPESPTSTAPIERTMLLRTPLALSPADDGYDLFDQPLSDRLRPMMKFETLDSGWEGAVNKALLDGLNGLAKEVRDNRDLEIGDALGIIGKDAASSFGQYVLGELEGRYFPDGYSFKSVTEFAKEYPLVAILGGVAAGYAAYDLIDRKGTISISSGMFSGKINLETMDWEVMLTYKVTF